MKAALYARVSTERQDAENQLAQLRDWAERLGISRRTLLRELNGSQAPQ